MVETVADLQIIVSEHPDAPLWWIGDWANEGERRFAIHLDDAVKTANAAARELRSMVTSPSNVTLPRGVKADAVSLRLPDNLPRRDWERVGGIITAVRTIQKLAAVPFPTQLARFRFGEVFVADDLLSEWLATIAMAANDLITLTMLSHSTKDPRVQWYHFRARVAHFYEVSKHLEETAELSVVKEFIASLPEPAQTAYETVLTIFKKDKALLSNVRQSVFHYPSLMDPGKPKVLRSNRLLPPVLRRVASQATSVRMGQLKDARYLFADDLTIGVVIRSVGGERNFAKLVTSITDGIHAFMRFMNPALDAHVRLRQEAGATVTYSE